MSDPFFYLLGSNNTANETPGHSMELTATLTDGDGIHGDVSSLSATDYEYDIRGEFRDNVSSSSATDDGINRTYTPSATDDGINISTISDPSDNGFQDTPKGRVVLSEHAGTLSAPEPTVLLNQIHQAATDVSQLVGRFGYKMSTTVQTPAIKEALFADPKLLRLPCLQYSDNFTCRIKRCFAEKPTEHTKPAPLLWWLWDELLEYLKPSYSTQGCELELTSFYPTIDVPYTIIINLGNKKNNSNIELTAAYGGPYDERRIFDAAIPIFRFPETIKNGKSTTATMSIDHTTYKEEACNFDPIFDYLMPRPENIWRHAMKAFPAEKHDPMVNALARTCKARDDIMHMSENHDRQCWNLLERFPAETKEYISREKLVGKEGGPYSRAYRGWC